MHVCVCERERERERERETLTFRSSLIIHLKLRPKITFKNKKTFKDTNS